jgi:hypothetical protein
VSSEFIIDDRSKDDLSTQTGLQWRLLTDGVMGGVSAGQLVPDRYLDRKCLRLSGDVSTHNNGGFIQMTLDLAANGIFDASSWDGVAIEVAGNDQTYNLHLRTAGLMFPWQSYRASFAVTGQWQHIRIAFSSLAPYRTTRVFHSDRIQRLGLVAIGREFTADLRLADLRLYRDAR